MTTKPKKKQIDFSVRPRANKDRLPATADEWVQDGKEQEKPTKQEEGPQKRLTLNLPAEMHTDFKGHCVREDVTIQDKVRALINRELAAAKRAEENGLDSV